MRKLWTPYSPSSTNRRRPIVLSIDQNPNKFKATNSWTFVTRLPPGDVMALTAAVRDLHKAYPDLSAPTSKFNRLNVHYDRIRKPGERYFSSKSIKTRANVMGCHMLDGYREYIGAYLGVDIPVYSLAPDLHFTDKELSCPPIGPPYWVVFAGGKSDFTNKIWDHENYQAVVDGLRGAVPFVQVGAQKDNHPPLSGVTNLVGKTSLRQLIVLIKHAQGVLCPITCGMHIAAACETPCVVLAGGREPPAWEHYPGHTYIHTIGQLDCCSDGGCFTRKADLGKRVDCRHVVAGPSQAQAACMLAITSDHVMTAILGIQRGEPVDQIIPRVRLEDYQPIKEEPEYEGKKSVRLHSTVRRLPGPAQEVSGKHFRTHRQAVRAKGGVQRSMPRDAGLPGTA